MSYTQFCRGQVFIVGRAVGPHVDDGSPASALTEVGAGAANLAFPHAGEVRTSAVRPSRLRKS